jgi:hypothetical protein
LVPYPAKGLKDVGYPRDVYIRATSERDWAALRRIRLRALEDAPEAFASTLAETRKQPEVWWRTVATPTPNAWRFLAYEGDEPRGIVGVMREDDDPSTPN